MECHHSCAAFALCLFGAIFTHVIVNNIKLNQPLYTCGQGNISTRLMTYFAGEPKAIPWTHVTPIRWAPARTSLLALVLGDVLPPSFSKEVVALR